MEVHRDGLQACGGQSHHRFGRALECDTGIASENARFSERFCKVGINTDDGGAWLLPRALTMSSACEIAFTGDAIETANALAGA